MSSTNSSLQDAYNGNVMFQDPSSQLPLLEGVTHTPYIPAAHIHGFTCVWLCMRPEGSFEAVQDGLRAAAPLTEEGTWSQQVSEVESLITAA